MGCGLRDCKESGMTKHKGVKPPEAFGERSRDWSLGHAGDEVPHLSMTGESRGWRFIQISSKFSIKF